MLVSKVPGRTSRGLIISIVLWCIKVNDGYLELTATANIGGRRHRTAYLYWAFAGGGIATSADSGT